MMAIAPIPFQPRKPGPLQILTLGRISTEHQNIENIDAMLAGVEQAIQTFYKGEYKLTSLGERASGMIVDRPSMMQALEIIENELCDLVVLEDLSRASRNLGQQQLFIQTCVANDVRCIAVNDGLDTADDNWEAVAGFAAARHGRLS